MFKRLKNCSINIKNGISYEGEIELDLLLENLVLFLMPCENKYIGEMRHMEFQMVQEDFYIVMVLIIWVIGIMV